MRVRRLLLPGSLFALLPCSVYAEISISGAAMNAASRIPSGFPDYGIAQGALFELQGDELGPASAQQAEFPLPRAEGLAGTTVQVTVGDRVVDVLLVSTSAKLVRAILPSEAPPGEGTVTVRYRGNSARTSIRVVESAFGIFQQPGSLFGPALAWNHESTGVEGNTILRSARAGQRVTVVGTGLGAIATDERNATEPGESAAEPKVLVGGQPARVISRGRRGSVYSIPGLPDGLSAIDQVTFEVPERVSGCSVPLTVEIGERLSNWAALSVAAEGGTCPEVSTLSKDDVSRLTESGPLAAGFLSLVRVALSVPLPGLGAISVRLDVGSASFQRLSPGSLPFSALGFPRVSPGNCMVTPGQLVNLNPAPGGNVQAAIDVTNGLDAGPWIRIRGPKGERQVKATQPGAYSDLIGQSISGLLEDGFLDPGGYTIDNGDGGSQVQSFSVPVVVLPAAAWINANEVTAVVRSRDLDVTWSTPDSSALVSIIGFSTALGGAIASFECLARPGDGQFRVPAAVLRSLPSSRPSGLTDVSGAIFVSIVRGERITLPGMDLAGAASVTLTGKALSFQ